ncbi:MAG: dihydropteroate synthase [Azovibrio sp.]
MTIFRCGAHELSLTRPLVMGIVNLTPDSFSGDGLVGDVDRAIGHALAQLEAGADILDLGAESSRPGAIPTSLEDELNRLLPVLEGLRSCRVPLSVDTYKPEVMRAALDAGADLINDINALRTPGALEAVADSNCGICLMHMQGEPLTMQSSPVYDDVVEEVRGFLQERVRACTAAGIDMNRLILDPGFGFGKTLEHNLELFSKLAGLRAEGLPVLVGVSRKSMLGLITGRSADARLAASVAAAVLAAARGASIIRVHDVAATRDALVVWSAIEQGVKSE